MNTDSKNLKQVTHGGKTGCLGYVGFTALGVCVVIIVWTLFSTCSLSSDDQSSPIHNNNGEMDKDRNEAHENNTFSYIELKSDVNRLIEEEAKHEIRAATCVPDKRITKLMEKIDSIGQELMSLENQTDETIELSEHCLAILAALRERRVYAYMLWAEGQLEKASKGKYENLKQLSQKDLIALYESLSLLNISIVRENMLNREIMTRLAEIYDCLSKENKPKVRVMAILQQADPFSSYQDIQIRKTLDDF